MIRFVDTYRDQFGVERICTTMRRAERGFITARGYHAAKSRGPSRREREDAELRVVIRRVFDANRRVYGVRKIKHALARLGYVVGRDRVARLMRELGIRGVVRGQRIRTTTPSHGLIRRVDLVDRSFASARPNQLWVADFTYVKTQQGTAYAAFIIDACTRRIIGWNVSNDQSTRLVLGAMEMALLASPPDLNGLIIHTDRGGHYASDQYHALLTHRGIRASVGSNGDSYDNALAETVIGLYKTELVRQAKTWPTVAKLELATFEWTHWFNHQRLHSYLNYQTPIEAHSKLYASPPTLTPA